MQTKYQYFIYAIVFIVINSCSCNSKKQVIISQDLSKVNVVKNIKISIVQKLKENAHLSIDERIILYKKLKKENPNDYNFENETELTLYGYSFLWANSISEAIEIFKLIVEQFPNSSNAYDSLGEAYLKNSKNDLALVNYQKSLELNPNNFAAEDVIEQIKNPNIKPIVFMILEKRKAFAFLFFFITIIFFLSRISSTAQFEPWYGIRMKCGLEPTLVYLLFQMEI